MPLVVSSLTGDASDMFDWTHSVNPGGPPDLSALLQMLREHYCGSYTFREQRTMVENICQGATYSGRVGVSPVRGLTEQSPRGDPAHPGFQNS